MMTPHVQSYHRAFDVAGKILEIAADDWYSDKEILKKLGAIYSVETVGEVVEAVESDNPRPASMDDSGIRTARIVEDGSNLCQSAVVDAAAKIVI